MFNHVRCQNNLVFPIHMTIKLYFRPYMYFIFLYVSTWLLGYLCQNWVLAFSKLSDLFLFPYLLVCHSPKSLRLNFWFLCLFPHFVPTFIVQLLSVLSLQYLLPNFFHFIHITTTLLGPEVFLKVLKPFGVRIPLYWLKLWRTPKSFCLYSLHIYLFITYLSYIMYCRLE